MYAHVRVDEDEEKQMPLANTSQGMDVTLSLPSFQAAVAHAPHAPSVVAALDDEPFGTEARERSPATSAHVVSFRAIFDAHYDYVWISLRRLGVQDRDREDITNEVFFRVHSKLDTYDPARPVRPWLFAFAVRAASDYRKLARHRREAGPPEQGPASIHPGPSPDEHAIRREEQRLVAEALEALDLPQRSVFVMHELDQVPVPTIAEAQIGRAHV